MKLEDMFEFCVSYLSYDGLVTFVKSERQRDKQFTEYDITVSAWKKAPAYGERIWKKKSFLIDGIPNRMCAEELWYKEFCLTAENDRKEFEKKRKLTGGKKKHTGVFKKRQPTNKERQDAEVNT